MTLAIHSKMPKILTAGMTWTATKGKASWPSTQDKKAIPVTIQNQHQPLISTVTALSASTGYYFYSTPIQKSKGTSYCSMNSKSFYCSQQSFRITVAFGGNSFHPQQKQITLRDSSNLQQHPMLPPAYLKDPRFQSSAGLKLLPQPTEVSKRLHFLLQPL